MGIGALAGGWDRIGSRRHRGRLGGLRHTHALALAQVDK